MKITKPQSQTLLDRWTRHNNDQTFMQFRRAVIGTIACDYAITVKWCGMWLCIETDGYCHT